MTTTFTDMSDYVARARLGDTFRSATAESITDYTVAAIEPATEDTTGADTERSLVLDYVMTSHRGRPSYRYRTLRHTVRAWSTGIGHSIDLNLAQPFDQIRTVENVKRRSAKGLAAAHDQALAQLEAQHHPAH